MAPKSQANGASTAYPSPIASRRTPVTITLLAFIAFLIFFSTTSLIPIVPSVSELSNSAKDAAKHIRPPSIPRPKLPNIHNPFRVAAHEPPVQRNSTSGEAKWYSDWKWLNPFSSSITLDENRSVLPPLPARPPIYTFYDAEAEKDEEVSAAENQLLLIWRRAWWAQGFRPVILGRAEAMMNPLYESLQIKKLDTSLEAEIMRWLAWGHMGAGILANWLILPMGPRDDHLISYLRRGQYPRLTRYESLGGGLFSGDQASIDAAISVTLSSGNLESAKTILEAINDPDVFSVDPKPAGIAFYETSTITSSYKAVANEIMTKTSSGLLSLAQLITSHLHITFLNTFTTGIAILSPHASHSTVLASPAINIARVLTTCPFTPVPDSCPPNNQKCTPCDPNAPLSVIYPNSYFNTSSLYTIGTTPHPYTLASFLARKPEITARYIRRETARDPWLLAVTKEMLGKDIAGPSRIVGFKESVASEWGSAHGIWNTAEGHYEHRDLEWHFGFSISSRNETGKSPDALSTLQPLLKTITMKPSLADIEHQNTLLAKAKEVIEKSEKVGGKEGIKEVVEAWNLADTEAWRFVRAFEARSRVDRLKWEEEERKFVGGSEGEGRGDGWGRWFDGR
ncbi:hypothetical protein MMC06_006059 [Schaereria dolodes]|nr:hypothetical protein [Schaereria dolodes]